MKKNFCHLTFARNAIIKRKVLVALFLVPLIFVLILTSSLMLSSHRNNKLLEELRDSTVLKISTTGIHHMEALEDKVLFETSDKDGISLLIEGLSFVPSIRSVSCECIGDIVFGFYKGNEIIQSFSFHHGTHIRMEHGSPGDLFLTEHSRSFLGNWLKERGISVTE